MKSYRAVSLSDLITTKEWMEAEKNNDQQAKNKILWTCGIDVDNEEGVEEELVEHRNWQNQVVKCIRYVGVERKDKEHLRSGLASIEGHMAAASTELRKDMIQMSRQSKYAYALNVKDNGEED